MVKVCSKCKEEKIETNGFFEFRKDQKCYRGVCRICLADDDMLRKYIQKCKELHLEYNEKDHIKYKFCSDCLLKKEISKYKSKHASICLDCSKVHIKNSSKKFHDKNVDYAKKSSRKTYSKHRDTILSKAREARLLPENKEKEKIRKNKYNKLHNYRRDTPERKIRHSISCRIRTVISKNRKSIKKILPYTIEELKAHLELLFKPWMSWNNWGIYNSKIWDDKDPKTWTWQIDHIIPQSLLPYTSMEDENFKKCWALSNLRPYSAKQNILDGVNRVRHKDVSYGV